MIAGLPVEAGSHSGYRPTFEFPALLLSQATVCRVDAGS